MAFQILTFFLMSSIQIKTGNFFEEHRLIHHKKDDQQ
jgi:hypothetical protein